MNVVFDLECDLIPSTKVFCIGLAIDDEPVEVYAAYPVTGATGAMPVGEDVLKNADLLIGHNIISYDIPMLAKLRHCHLHAKLRDTILILKLMFSKDHLFNIDRGIEDMPKKLWGAYSLEAFGWRFGDYKGDFHDFSRLSAKMVTYCKQDVSLTRTLYEWAIEQENYPLEKVIELEQKSGEMLQRQQDNGFHFDIKAARDLATKMRLEMLRLERKLHRKFKPMFLKDGPEKQAKGSFKRKTWLEDSLFQPWTVYFKYEVTYTFYKNGKIKLPNKRIKWSETPLRFIEQVTQSTYQPIKYTKFEPSSRAHIKSWLQHHYSWEPIIFTDKGNAKVNYDTLGDMEYEEGEILKSYLKISKDLSQLMTGAGSLINSYNEETHAIHHRCDTMGTNTGRMAHSKPNLGQVPSTKEFRSLFTAPEGYSILGADLSAQELRVLAHYLMPYDGGIYAEAVLNGDKKLGTDIHTMNMKAAGLGTRDEAKTLIYGILYGSSATRIGYGLWKAGMTITYTKKEYDKKVEQLSKRIDMAKKEGKVVQSADGTFLFPIAKDMYVPFTELLIEQAIYGERIYNQFIDKTVGYKQLQEAVQAEAKEKKWITGLDGRRLPVRSLHSALNLLFQGAAAVITKYWMVEFNKQVGEAGYYYGDEYWSNAVIHDEQQLMVKNGLEDVIGPILRSSAQAIAPQLDLKVPQDAEYSYGPTWWETH